MATVGALSLTAPAAYTVQPGDTLSEVARDHGVPTADLASTNGISDPDRLVAGTTLTLPAGTTQPASAGGSSTSGTYTVRPGDTLSEVARDHGVPTADLASTNGISDPDRLVAGTTLTLPADTGRPDSNDPSSPTSAEALLEDVATRHGWSTSFVKAIAWQESGWQQSVVSHAGAVGIMQVLPSTGEFVSENLVGRQLDLEDPRDNVEAGVTFLQYLWELTDRDVEMTLAGYYQGLTSVRINGMYDDTERYVDNVLALRDRF